MQDVLDEYEQWPRIDLTAIRGMRGEDLLHHNGVVRRREQVALSLNQLHLLCRRGRRRRQCRRCHFHHNNGCTKQGLEDYTVAGVAAKPCINREAWEQME